MTTADPTKEATSRQDTSADSELKPAQPSAQWWLRKLISVVLMLGVGIALIAAMGVAQRMGWISAGAGGPAVSGETATQIHTCPMHPQIRQPGPGSCPICGMALVAATSDGDADVDELAVNIDPAARRLANIETVKVRREPVLTAIETVGAIAIDESRMSTIASYIDGRIERIFADYTGVVVARGDHLAVVYSPELYSAQIEYVESRKALSTDRPSSLESVRNVKQKLAANTRQRLVELGMTAEQIAELEKSGEAQSRLTIYSPIGGTVTEKMAMEGKYVKAGEPIYRIADLSTVWLMLELYPEDASRIRFGQRVEAELQSLPGHSVTGRVAFIDPTVNRKNRTVGVRVEFLNEQGRLRPGDYATARIFLPVGQQGEVYDAGLAGRWISPMHPQVIRDEPGACPICGMDLVPTSIYGYSEQPVEQPPSIYVPRSAVLMAGNNSVVYVESEPGRFEIRPVTLGPILKDRVIIQGGLKEDDLVATAGNFLIDSQMQLAGKPSLIDPTRAIARGKGAGGDDGPLLLENNSVITVAGTTGEQLEDLYKAYFSVQKAFAADRKPSPEEAKTIYDLAKILAESEELPEAIRSAIGDVATNSEHLHHMSIADARLKAFRPISQAILKVVTQVRGADSAEPLYHMFCPMVKGGSGDWLQDNDDLRNPFYGEKMLKCGDVVREIVTEVAASPNQEAAEASLQDSPGQVNP